MSKPKIPEKEFEHPEVEHKAMKKPPLRVKFKKSKRNNMEAAKNLLTLNVIKTKDGVFLSYGGQFNYGYSGKDLLTYLYDGEKGELTFHSFWIKVKKIPEKIEKYLSPEFINYRFQLEDKTLSSTQIPLEVEAIRGDDGWQMKTLNHLRSLYKLIWDQLPPKLSDVPFECKVIAEIDKFETPLNFKYPTDNVPVEEQDIGHYSIDQILFPGILLHARPCYLSSKQSYDLVRYYVKTHINPTEARVTSDYNFCFAVEKIIELDKEEMYLADVSGWRSKKPKYENRYRKTRTVQIFEMTHSPENYKGYTPIEGFKGTNHKDLQKNIKKYLDDLMVRINTPLCDCPHCQGRGVLIKDKNA